MRASIPVTRREHASAVARVSTSRLSALDEGRVLGRRLMLVEATNATLILADAEGRRRQYTDLMSAYGAVNFGHCNPDLCSSEAPTADLAAGCAPQAAEDVADWLCASLSRPTSKVLFQVGGSFAVSTAIALALRARPGRVVALRGSFHGLGIDALAATDIQKGMALQRTSLVDSLAGAFTFLEPGKPVDIDWATCAAFLFEPVQGANGYVPVPVDWLQETAAAARAAGVTVIADEVQAGFHRHGPLSPTTASGIDADILLFSKSLTNGIYPLSAVVYDEGLEDGLGDGPMLAHTFQMSALGTAAAQAVASYLDIVDAEAMARGIEVVLQPLAADLRQVSGISDVAVTGPTLSFEAGPGLSAEIVARCVAQGVLPFTGGATSNRVRVAPPLTIPHEQLSSALEVLSHVVHSVDVRPGEGS